ncbi:MAG: antitoxin [Actinobacteria bacterium]|nr:antitoxin [Actinomycetota bacterium]
MTRTSLFYNNRTQAVRLPKAAAFPEGVTAVEVTVVGNARVITPVAEAFDYWWEHGARVSDDFMIERDQPPMQERDW